MRASVTIHPIELPKNMAAAVARYGDGPIVLVDPSLGSRERRHAARLVLEKAEREHKLVATLQMSECIGVGGAIGSGAAS